MGTQMSVSLLHHCQYPGCDVVLHLCKMFSLGKLNKGHGGSLYCFIQVYGKLQLPPNKMFN